MSKLTADQEDALKEVGNVGAGNAANALSSMLDLKVTISATHINVTRMSELWAGSEVNMTSLIAVVMAISGDVPGHIIVAFEQEAARHMAIVYVQRVLHKQRVTDLEMISTVQEFGNILAGAYLRAVATLTKRSLSLSVPTILTGMTKTVLSKLPGYEEDPEVALLTSRFITESGIISGQVVLTYNTEDIITLLGQFA